MAYRDVENFISQYIFNHDCDTNFYRVCKEVYYRKDRKKAHGFNHGRNAAEGNLSEQTAKNVVQ